MMGRREGECDGRVRDVCVCKRERVCERERESKIRFTSIFADGARNKNKKS